MVARDRTEKSRRLQLIGDRLRELAPWTDPELIVLDGGPALQVTASHLLSVTATNASGRWRLEERDMLCTDSEPARRAGRDLDVPWDGDVSPVADELLAICVREWMGTMSSSESSAAMKTKAAENLEALGLPAAMKAPM